MELKKKIASWFAHKIVVMIYRCWIICVHHIIIIQSAPFQLNDGWSKCVCVCVTMARGGNAGWYWLLYPQHRTRIHKTYINDVHFAPSSFPMLSFCVIVQFLFFFLHSVVDFSSLLLAAFALVWTFPYRQLHHTAPFASHSILYTIICSLLVCVVCVLEWYSTWTMTRNIHKYISIPCNRVIFSLNSCFVKIDWLICFELRPGGV